MKTFRNSMLCVPAALWYWVIWRFSAQSAAVSGDLSDRLLWKLLALVSPAFSRTDTDTQTAAVELLSFFERKAAHMFLYFVLILLIWLALLPLVRGRKGQAALAASLCAVLAGLDEYHQTFIPGRSGEVRDVCVDLTGAAIALLLVVLLLWTARRRKRGCRDAVSLLPAGLCAALTAGLAVISISFVSLPAFAWAVERFVPAFASLSGAGQASLLALLSPVIGDLLRLLACCLLGCAAVLSLALMGCRFFPALGYALLGSALWVGVFFAFSGMVLVLNAVSMVLLGCCLSGLLWLICLLADTAAAALLIR